MRMMYAHASDFCVGRSATKFDATQVPRGGLAMLGRRKLIANRMQEVFRNCLGIVLTLFIQTCT